MNQFTTNARFINEVYIRLMPNKKWVGNKIWSAEVVCLDYWEMMTMHYSEGLDLWYNMEKKKRCVQ